MRFRVVPNQPPQDLAIGQAGSATGSRPLRPSVSPRIDEEEASPSSDDDDDALPAPDAAQLGVHGTGRGDVEPRPGSLVPGVSTEQDGDYAQSDAASGTPRGVILQEQEAEGCPRTIR